MRHLHEIIPARLTAWTWASLRGRNGRQIGAPRGFNTWAIYAHAFEITRRDPRELPPILPDAGSFEHTILRDARRYYSPWGRSLEDLNRDQRLTALCGPIRSQSLNPRIEAADPTYNWVTTCPECETLARRQQISIRTPNDLSQRDPWYRLTRVTRGQDDNWMFEPDPVTGI